MKLESLPNELLLDLLGYFNVIHLYRAFHGLNFRFNLLVDHCPSFHLNLKSISKKDFDFICQQHLPTIAHRIISLSLSNDDDTPEQIACFLSRGFILCQFTHLQSLSLYHIRFDSVTYKILQELPHLQQLTSLKIDKFQYQYDKENILYLFNIIWSLPKLTHCHLTDFSENYNFSGFTFPEIISSTIEYVCIERVQFNLNQLFDLAKSTPRLRNLRITINKSHYLDQSLSHIISSLAVLKIAFSPESFDVITNLLQNTPNLCHLTFLLESIKINGHQWEQFITDYLPKLKVFELVMSIKFRQNSIRESEVDELLDSFRTPFWLVQHQWFVRCDWTGESDLDVNNPYMILYTLPYFQNTFYYSGISDSKSTCPNDRDYWSYDCVHDLLLDNIGLIKYFSQYPIRFPNLRELRLTSSLLNSLSPIFTTFDQLVSLYIIGYEDDDQSDLQALFDHAPRLSLLKFNTYRHSQLSLKNSSIRRLYLPWSNESFGIQQCTEFCRSSLFQQCEVLHIETGTREIIFDFLANMPNLRSLSFTYRDDKWTENGKLNQGRKDELMEWLNDHLPSNCWITRPQFRLIRLWIA